MYAPSISTAWMTPTNLNSSTQRDHELKETLMKVTLDAQQDRIEIVQRGVKQSSTSKPTTSAIYQSAKATLSSSRELLGHFERASQQVASGKSVPTMEPGWEKDSQTLQRILQKQGEKIKLEIHRLLNEDPRSSKEKAKDDVSEFDTEIWNRFAVGEAKAETLEVLEGRIGDTWAVVAKNAQRGVRRTVQSLPKDGEWSSRK